MLMSVRHPCVCHYICVCQMSILSVVYQGLLVPLPGCFNYYSCSRSIPTFIHRKCIIVYIFCSFFSHLVSSYYNHYYSTCDSCVLQDINQCYNGFHLCGLSSIWSAWCGSAGLKTVLQEQEPQWQMPSQAYGNYAMGSLCFMWAIIMVFAFCFQVFWCGCYVHQWGLNHWGLLCCSPMEYTLGRHICLLVMVHGPCQ